MNFDSVVSLLIAFGLGSIISVLVQAWITKLRDRKHESFQERRDAYMGLLEAYHQAAVEGTEVAAKNFAYWQMRCDLVAPQNVRQAIENIIETNDDKEARSRAHDRLKSELRKDLNIAES